MLLLMAQVRIHILVQHLPNVSDLSLGVIQLDPWLEPYRDALKHRFSKAQQWIKTINETEGGLEKFSRGYETFGFTFSTDGDIMYR